MVGGKDQPKLRGTFLWIMDYVYIAQANHLQQTNDAKTCNH